MTTAQPDQSGKQFPDYLGEFLKRILRGELESIAESERPREESAPDANNAIEEDAEGVTLEHR